MPRSVGREGPRPFSFFFFYGPVDGAAASCTRIERSARRREVRARRKKKQTDAASDVRFSREGFGCDGGRDGRVTDVFGDNNMRIRPVVVTDSPTCSETTAMLSYERV